MALKKLFYRFHRVDLRFEDLAAYRADLGALIEKYCSEIAVPSKIGVQVLLDSARRREGPAASQEERRCECPACAACRQLQEKVISLLALPRSAQPVVEPVNVLYFGSPEELDCAHVNQCLRHLAADLSADLVANLAASAAAPGSTSLLTCGVFPVTSPDGRFETRALYVTMTEEARSLLHSKSNRTVSTTGNSKWLTAVNFSTRPGIVTKEVKTIVDNQMSDVVAKGLLANYDCAYLWEKDRATGTLANEEWHKFVNQCIGKRACGPDRRIMDLKLAARAFNARKDEVMLVMCMFFLSLIFPVASDRLVSNAHQIENKLHKGSHEDLNRERNFLGSQRVGIVIPVTPPHKPWVEVHKDIVEMRRKKNFHWTDDNVQFLMRCLEEWMSSQASHPPTATQKAWSWIALNRAFPGDAQPSRTRLQNKIERMTKEALLTAFPVLAERITSATLDAEGPSESANTLESISVGDSDSPPLHLNGDVSADDEDDVDLDAADDGSLFPEHSSHPFAGEQVPHLSGSTANEVAGIALAGTAQSNSAALLSSAPQPLLSPRDPIEGSGGEHSELEAASEVAAVDAAEGMDDLAAASRVGDPESPVDTRSSVQILADLGVHFTPPSVRANVPRRVSAFLHGNLFPDDEDSASSGGENLPSVIEPRSKRPKTTP